MNFRSQGETPSCLLNGWRLTALDGIADGETVPQRLQFSLVT